MPISVQCPQCQRKLNVPDSLLGKRVKCPSCATAFEATDSNAGAVTSAPPPPVFEMVEDDPPERPRRRQERSMDFDDDEPRRGRPHRGATILVLGILGLCLSCCPLAGWILGGSAMSMGGADLYEMAKGRMDRDGRGITQAGRICGIIAVIIASLSCVGNAILRFAAMQNRM